MKWKITRNLLAFGTALALNNAIASDFENQSLGSKMPYDQYNAIRQGLIAQCKYKARPIAQESAELVPNCEYYKRLYGESNPLTYMNCQNVIDARHQAYMKTFGDVLAGCMASEGWLFVEN